MSIRTVVTRGFGSYGTISLVVVRGYGSGSSPTPPPTPGRSGLGGDDVPRRSPHKGWDREEWKRRKANMDAMYATIQETYDKLTKPEVPEPIRLKAIKIAKPLFVRSMPHIDWASIASSYQRTNALIKLQEELEHDEVVIELVLRTLH